MLLLTEESLKRFMAEKKQSEKTEPSVNGHGLSKNQKILVIVLVVLSVVALSATLLLKSADESDESSDNQTTREFSEEYTRADYFEETADNSVDDQEKAINLSQLANLQYNDGNIEEAIATYEEVLSLTPEDNNTISVLADIYYIEGNLKRANELYRDLLTKLESNPDSDQGEIKRVKGLIEATNG